ncbi:MAG: hypothetical protein OTJ45_04110, partial [Alphaproteobacteria bacterium]|nr:hypothetical protein [Alphaproteobacteria bacterium]
SGTLTVTNFDGGGLTGTFSSISSASPGGHSFSGGLSGTGRLSNVTGGHNSSFYTSNGGNHIAAIGGDIHANGTVEGTSYVVDGVHVQACSGGLCQ